MSPAIANRFPLLKNLPPTDIFYYENQLQDLKRMVEQLMDKK